MWGKFLTTQEALNSLKELYFQNNYQQDDTYGLSFISGLVVLHSTCFELQGAHYQFTFLLYRQPLAYCVIFCCIPSVGERVKYSKRLHSMPEAVTRRRTGGIQQKITQYARGCHT